MRMDSSIENISPENKSIFQFGYKSFFKYVYRIKVLGRKVICLMSSFTNESICGKFPASSYIYLSFSATTNFCGTFNLEIYAPPLRRIIAAFPPKTLLLGAFFVLTVLPLSLLSPYFLNISLLLKYLLTFCQNPGIPINLLTF